MGIKNHKAENKNSIVDRSIATEGIAGAERRAPRHLAATLLLIALSAAYASAGVTSADVFPSFVLEGVTKVFSIFGQTRAPLGTRKSEVESSATALGVVCDITVNAGSLIQPVIDSASVVAGQTVCVGAGTFTENLIIKKRITLVGQGNGTGAGATIIQSAAGSTPVIKVDGYYVPSYSASSYDVVIQNLRVKGATVDTGNNGSGILMSGPFDGHMTVKDLVSTGNTGFGFAINTGDNSTGSYLIENSTFSSNNTGIKIGEKDKVTGLTITGSHIDSNTLFGLYKNDGTGFVKALSIENSTFNNNPYRGLYLPEGLKDLSMRNSTVDMSGLNILETAEIKSLTVGSERRSRALQMNVKQAEGSFVIDGCTFRGVALVTTASTDSSGRSLNFIGINISQVGFASSVRNITIKNSDITDFPIGIQAVGGESGLVIENNTIGVSGDDPATRKALDFIDDPFIKATPTVRFNDIFGGLNWPYNAPLNASRNHWGSSNSGPALGRIVGTYSGQVTSAPYITTFTEAVASSVVGFYPNVSTTPVITGTSASPKVGTAYTVSGTVTVVTDLGPSTDLQGKVTVSDGSASCEDATLTATVTSNVYEFSCEITSTSSGAKNLSAGYSDSSSNVFYGSSTSANYPVTVGKAPVTLTVTGSQAYGTTSAIFSQTNDAPSGITVVSTGLTCTALSNNAAIPSATLAAGGTYTIKGSFCSGASLTGTGSGNYDIVYSGSTYTVNKGAPTATLAVSNSPATYDGTAKTATVIVSSSSVPGSVTNIKLAGANTQTDAGTYAVTADFVPTDTSNYSTLTNQSAGNFIINQATPTITISNIPSGAVYGGTFTPTYTYTGDGTTSVSSDSSGVCAVSGGTVRFVGVGTCTLVASATSGRNYSAVTGSEQTFSVGKATLTVTATTMTKTYGTGVAPIGTLFTTSGLANGDAISSVTLASNGYTASANVGTYAITPSAAFFSIGSASNYTIGYANGEMIVVAKPLTITAVTDSKVYDGTTGSSKTPSVSSLYGTDTVTGLSQAFDSKNVLGTLASTLRVKSYTVNDGNRGLNYEVLTGVTTGTISKAAVAVDAAAASKLQGASDPALSYTLRGLVASDTVASAVIGAATCTRSSGEDIGVYTITCGLGDLSSANYSFTAGATASFSIAAPLNTPTATSTGSNVTVPFSSGTTLTTLTFNNVTSAGETTVQTTSPTDAGYIPPPAGTSAGTTPIYFSVSSTATFSGQVSVCFTYPEGNWGGTTPRLYHYTDGAWIDVTLNPQPVGTPANTICGRVTSFSPFFLGARLIPTAAGASIEGSVSDAFGRFVPGAEVRVTDLATGQATVVKANQFGKFRVEGLLSGTGYIVNASAKGFRSTSPRYLTLQESLTDLRLTLEGDAQPRDASPSSRPSDVKQETVRGKPRR